MVSDMFVGEIPVGYSPDTCGLLVPAAVAEERSNRLASLPDVRFFAFNPDDPQVDYLHFAEAEAYLHSSGGDHTDAALRASWKYLILRAFASEPEISVVKERQRDFKTAAFLHGFVVHEVDGARELLSRPNTYVNGIKPVTLAFLLDLVGTKYGANTSTAD